MEIVEIKSSHDLTAMSADARRSGAHSYQVNCRQFVTLHRSWERDKAQQAGPLGLMTLSLERIWITAAESKQIEAAIQSTQPTVLLD